MSLKKKIGLSFFIGTSIIIFLVGFEYANFTEIEREIRFLELADAVKGKSLELRRHEKNFFLYPLKAKEEAEATRRYLSELDGLLKSTPSVDKTGAFSALGDLIREYGQRFGRIESLLNELLEVFAAERASRVDLSQISPLIELSFYERPSLGAEFLEKAFRLQPESRLISGLRELDGEVTLLRKNGEDILSVTRELDRRARDNAEAVINKSQGGIIIFFFLFFVSGVVTLFLINRNVVNRLRLLIDLVEKTGKGTYSRLNVPLGKWDNDEVGVLIQRFNDMEGRLSERERELERKNLELLQSKKLAAIGTLAAGVAHELNNPLNNIYISAQVLKREARDECSAFIRETLDDIVSQAMRVKGIVGDLLEFARGREPQFVEVDLKGLIEKAYARVAAAMSIEGIQFSLDADPKGIMVMADPEQIERVFINLFSNAVEAMAGRGSLSVGVRASENAVNVVVSDTGPGMDLEVREKLFEPFFSTKDKGTGLGLAIVFNIIKRHNGDIRVESVKGRGTSFAMKLPRRKG
ncbi:MAG: ATP-binding protein [Chloroflexota bacterium]